MSRSPGLGGIMIAIVSAIGLVVATWADVDAAGRGGSRGGGGMSRSSPAKSGGMSSRPAPQPSSRQAAPTQRPAAPSGSRTPTASRPFP